MAHAPMHRDASIPSTEQVRQRMALLLSSRLGLPRDALLAGAAFEQIDPAFDSLHLIEAVLLAQGEFGVELDLPLPGPQASLDALVRLVLHRTCVVQ